MLRLFSKHFFTTAASFITTKGETLYRLGGKKKVTVSRWNDAPLIHIRQYYGEEPNVFLAKKGITLSPAEFAVFLDLAETLQQDVERQTSGAAAISSTQQQQPRQPQQRPSTSSQGGQVVGQAFTRPPRRQGVTGEQRQLQPPAPKRLPEEPCGRHDENANFVYDSQIV